jgi:hypothetical protein
MTKSTIRGMLGGLLVPFIAVSALAQGLSFEILHGTDETKVEKSIYMPGMFKSEGKDGHISIMRLDKEMFITTSPAEKTYREMTFAQMETQMKQGRSKAVDAMKKRMEGMPPEKRKMMEERIAAMTGQREEVKMEIVPTGEHKVIDGYQCTGYTIKRNGKEEETVWASKDVPNFASMRKDFQRFAAFLTSMRAGGNAFASFEKIDGFPIETTGTGHSERMRKIQAGSFPVSAFEVPPGYTKEKSRLGGEVE